MPCCYDPGVSAKAGFQYGLERGPIATCARYGGSLKLTVDASNRCIEDQDIIDSTLANPVRRGKKPVWPYW